MKIKSIKSTTKDTYYSLAPINWLLRYTALSNISRKGISLTSSVYITKCIIYVIVFGALNFYCMCLKIQSFKGNKQTGLIRFSDVIQVTYWFSYFVYISDVYTAYKYGREYLLRYFDAFKHIDSILGIPQYDEIRRTVINSTVLSLATYVFISSIDYTFWVMIEGWKLPSIYAVDYVYFFLNILTVLDVSSHVIQVEYRLKMIRCLLEEKSGNKFLEPIIEVNKFDASSMDDTQINMPVWSLKSLSCNRYLETTWFSKCYLILLEQVAFLNTSFGFRVLLHSVDILVNMINLLNLAIRVVNGTMTQAGKDIVITTSTSFAFTFLSTTSSVLRALNYEFVAIVLMYRCEQAYKQSESMLETIDILLASKKNHSGLKKNLLEFRNLLITRPIKFHAAKFFNMDYTFLVSLNSVVVTYTIIMLQNMQ